MPNPALKSLEFLIGEWEVEGAHPYLPGTNLRGRCSFEWIEGGAFLMMRSEIDHPEFPDGIGIFGSDDVAKKTYLLTFDERGTSRKYEVDVAERELNWWRDEPSFSQRYRLTVEGDGKTMSGKGEMSIEGKPWEGDLSLTYRRV